VISLKPHGPPEASGRQKYVPLTTTVGQVSQYRDTEFALEGLDGYWQWPEKAPLPQEGEKFRFWLTTKPKTGARAKPGSKYQDVVRAEPVTTDLSGDEYTDVTEPSHPDDAPVESPQRPPEAPERATSPLSGRPVPPEWNEAIEYHLYRHETSRLSIEQQSALKAMVEVLPSLEDPATRLQFTNAIMELAARLGRFTWPAADVVDEAWEETK